MFYHTHIINSTTVVESRPCRNKKQKALSVTFDRQDFMRYICLEFFIFWEFLILSVIANSIVKQYLISYAAPERTLHFNSYTTFT